MHKALPTRLEFDPWPLGMLADYQVLLPSQVVAIGGGSPEILLWAVVLEDGIREYFSRLRRDPDCNLPNTRQAWEWIHSSEDYPGAFLWICNLLEMVPSRVRKRIEEIADEPHKLQSFEAGLRLVAGKHRGESVVERVA